MSITKNVVVDQVTISANGTLMYRTVTQIIEDDVQISQAFHRVSLVPGQDMSGQPANVIAIAQVAWTPEVISTYQAEQERIASEMAARMAAAAAQQESVVQG